MDLFKQEIPKHFNLPQRIHRLPELAYNLWWVWTPDAQYLFSHIDSYLWECCRHNPVAFLSKVERPRLNAVISDRIYLERYDRLMAQFDAYLQAENTWFQQEYGKLSNQMIAYFSFEFGLHESLPVYAGGLGILAGDHLKEASDLGIPLVGIGFIYNQGYFVQHITEDGWQETGNYHLNFFEMPIYPLYELDGDPLMISIDLPGRKVYARLWKVEVGRVALYLLDSNVEENSPPDRELTSRLYSSDLEIRVSQEMLLGIGGVRALRALGYEPTVWHMNEGHSAFLALERIREMVSKGVELSTALEQVRASNVFTTHTPVPAGIDQFPLWLVDKYFPTFWQELGLTRDEFVDLGRQPQSWGDSLSMAVLAIHLSARTNAVSELHGEVSRRMWKFLFPECKKEEDVPIIHITNGVHTGTWLARRMRVLYDKYLGENWMDRIDDLDLWERLLDIPNEEIWAVRAHLKRKLIRFVTDRARQQWLSGNAHPVQTLAGGVLLDPHVLTIGFARRFATYKRGYLILSDYERLLRILNNPEMPVQIVFAGKAHPADEPGKLIIQQVYRAVKDSRTGGRMAFVEDYDMNISRALVQGVDVWLNTPRRPNEASGTSGMKAAINGALNFSVLDGWWREAYNGNNGWAIGEDLDYSDPNEQDRVDAESLYDILENEIVPLFYTNRTQNHVPLGWVARMKESIRTLLPQFSMQRMVKEYMRELYLPAAVAIDSHH
ncbi:MAG: alpha-glucan family phosphorylase [Anaerolineae bacterium]|nr:alpha-glucan family phosphorylase [Anaerolineae bacterium]